MSLPERIVATGGRFPSANYNYGLNVGFAGRKIIAFGGDASYIRFRFETSYVTVSPTLVETPMTDSFTLKSLALECNSNGKVAQVTFNGKTSVVMSAAQAYYDSDPVYPSQLGLQYFPADGQFWLRHFGYTNTANATVPCGNLLTGVATGNKYSSFPMTTAVDYTLQSGLLPAQIGETNAGVASVVQTFGPTGMIGRFRKANVQSQCIIGDSIAWGVNDYGSGGYVGRITGQGPFHLAAVAAGSDTGTIAQVSLAIVGDIASVYILNNARRSTYYQYCNVMVEELGINDIGSTGSGVVATIQANKQTIWAAGRAAGIQKIFVPYYMPRTSSSDTWKTEANETYISAYNSSGKTEQMNTWLSGTMYPGTIDGYDAMNSSRGVDPYKWVVNNTANYATNDGLHPTHPIALLLAPSIRTTFLGFTVNDGTQTQAYYLQELRTPSRNNVLMPDVHNVTYWIDNLVLAAATAQSYTVPTDTNGKTASLIRISGSGIIFISFNGNTAAAPSGNAIDGSGVLVWNLNEPLKLSVPPYQFLSFLCTAGTTISIEAWT